MLHSELLLTLDNIIVSTGYIKNYLQELYTWKQDLLETL